MSRPYTVPGRADALPGEQDVDATARAEVENGLAFVELDQGQWVPATETRRDGGLG